MILSDRDIKKALEEGIIKIKPFDRSQIGPCSVDLRLSDEFRIFKVMNKTHIDPFHKDSPEEYTKIIKADSENPFIMHPGEFVLAATLEWIEIGNTIAAKLDGRSSLGRLGIVVQTAGYIDPGFKGNITLELGNIGKMPVALYPGMRICRLTFKKLTSECEVPYGMKSGQKYLMQRGVGVSKIYEDKEFEEARQRKLTEIK